MGSTLLLLIGTAPLEQFIKNNQTQIVISRIIDLLTSIARPSRGLLFALCFSISSCCHPHRSNNAKAPHRRLSTVTVARMPRQPCWPKDGPSRRAPATVPERSHRRDLARRPDGRARPSKAHQHLCAVQRPPPMSTNVPVAYEALSDNNHTIASATSSGRPPRPIGMMDSSLLTRPGSPLKA